MRMIRIMAKRLLIVLAIATITAGSGAACGGEGDAAEPSASAVEVWQTPRIAADAHFSVCTGTPNPQAAAYAGATHPIATWDTSDPPHDLDGQAGGVRYDGGHLISRTEREPWNLWQEWHLEREIQLVACGTPLPQTDTGKVCDYLGNISKNLKTQSYRVTLYTARERREIATVTVRPDKPECPKVVSAKDNRTLVADTPDTEQYLTALEPYAYGPPR